MNERAAAVKVHRTIEIEVESSCYADDSYWLPGAEYYAQKVILVLDEGFDETQYSDDELYEMADDTDCDSVRYEKELVQP